MIRDLELAFVKLHILYHADKEEVFGVGLMGELARHGYEVSPGTLYPTLAKLERGGFLTCEARTIDHKQRKYYRITVLFDVGNNPADILENHRNVLHGPCHNPLSPLRREVINSFRVHFHYSVFPLISVFLCGIFVGRVMVLPVLLSLVSQT